MEVDGDKQINWRRYSLCNIETERGGISVNEINFESDDNYGDLSKFNRSLTVVISQNPVIENSHVLL